MKIEVEVDEEWWCDHVRDDLIMARDALIEQRRLRAEGDGCANYSHNVAEDLRMLDIQIQSYNNVINDYVIHTSGSDPLLPAWGETSEDLDS